MASWSRLLIIALLCSSCAQAPQRAAQIDALAMDEYSRSLVKDRPESGEKAAGLAGVTDPYHLWWEFYGDEDLDALITGAFDNNPGIAQTRKRLEQAAASARVSFADLLPDMMVSGARSTSNGDNASPSSFSLRGAAGYELDLWGGNRASYRASSQSAHAAAADVQAAAITLSASIVENWISLLSLREEEALLRAQIETNEMVLDLQHKRYMNGAAEALDVLQQSGALESAKTQLPDILAAQETTEHQILLLAGRSPSDVLYISRESLPAPLPVPASGVPADLLQNRPDINAAWLRVSSADWASEAARIDRLPNFDISLDYTTASTKFKNLFNVWALDLALNMVAPLFDGGQRAAEQARQGALADERFQAYRETVLGAIGEVEDALSLNHHQASKIEALERQLDVSRSTLEQATISYGNGDTDYIAVLNSLINTQSLEQQLVRARRDLALYRVDLYRSLGVHAWPNQHTAQDARAEDTHG